jgi:hypothetical protein
MVTGNANRLGGTFSANPEKSPGPQKLNLAEHPTFDTHCHCPTTSSIMSSLRIARAALRARPAAIARPIQRRGYAEVANDKIKLSLALPHQVRHTSRRDVWGNASSWNYRWRPNAN